MHRDFWAMGGYAFFVWPSIGLAIGVLIWNILSARRHHARALVRARRALAMARSETT
ncbi:MAG: heme exporter protein CcmD [Gammaproteobacteria bacterium]|nr:heme exporter protein CcmD [Gammaproteobacteria bacterium]MDE2304095.1 heme exporter protein CcmD [Gammaproteobacteria bacterium]